MCCISIANLLNMKNIPPVLAGPLIVFNLDIRKFWFTWYFSAFIFFRLKFHFYVCVVSQVVRSSDSLLFKIEFSLTYEIFPLNWDIPQHPLSGTNRGEHKRLSRSSEDLRKQSRFGSGPNRNRSSFSHSKMCHKLFNQYPYPGDFLCKTWNLWFF